MGLKPRLIKNLLVTIIFCNFAKKTLKEDQIL